MIMFWIFILVCDLIIPLTMLVGGLIMWKHCPGRMSRILGYRSERSMKSEAAWRFANVDCGKRWFVIGLVMTVLSIIAHILLYSAGEDAVSNASLVIMALETAALFISLIPTERALKQRFGE